MSKKPIPESYTLVINIDDFKAEITHAYEVCESEWNAAFLNVFYTEAIRRISEATDIRKPTIEVLRMTNQMEYRKWMLSHN